MAYTQAIQPIVSTDVAGTGSFRAEHTLKVYSLSSLLKYASTSSADILRCEGTYAITRALEHADVVDFSANDFCICGL